jgi:hypothetical protein
MEQEQRNKMDPVPDDVLERLNTNQLLVLRLVKDHGWGMKFVRRPSKQKPTFVIYNNDSEQYAVLDDDGTLNIESGIKIRSDSHI